MKHTINGFGKEEKTVNKPLNNPYKPGTILYRLFEEDFSDKTIKEIADEVNSLPHYISCALNRIQDETGYRVPRMDGRKLMWKNGNRKYCKKTN